MMTAAFAPRLQQRFDFDDAEHIGLLCDQLGSINAVEAHVVRDGPGEAGKETNLAHGQWAPCRRLGEVARRVESSESHR